MGKRVLCIGSAVMDITASAIGEQQTWKEKQRIDEIGMYLGGDAANQCSHMASLGLTPSLVTVVGDDTRGRMVKALLESRGVDTGYVRERKGTPTAAALVLVDPAGERHVFSVKGAHSLLSREDLPPLSEGDWQAISLASIFSMPRLEEDGLEAYLAQARERGIPVFADLAADKLGLGLEGIRRFLPLIDYFVPSLYDVQKMTGCTGAQACAARLRALGCRHVVIKCGAKGCYALEEDAGYQVPALPVQPVDTTGAGDCLNAVLLTRILKGDPLQEALRYACAAASLSTLSRGASEIRLREEQITASLPRLS